MTKFAREVFPKVARFQQASGMRFLSSVARFSAVSSFPFAGNVLSRFAKGKCENVGTRVLRMVHVLFVNLKDSGTLLMQVEIVKGSTKSVCMLFHVRMKMKKVKG